MERAGFVVFFACNAEKAFQVFRNETIDLLLTDVQMGDGMNAVELAELIMEEQPETKVLVMSGFPEKEALTKARNLPFLRKPFTPAIVTEAVRGVLESTPAQAETKTRMDDLFKRTQAELRHGRGDFLTTELAICSRYAHLASTMWRAGKSSLADRHIADAEESYATARRFLTDPKSSQHLTIKTVQESVTKLDALREELDQLQRSRKSSNP